MLTLGDLELSMIPRIAVPMSDREVYEDAATAKALADVFELRIDQFQQHDPSYARRVCEEASTHGVPLLATVRAANEGGAVTLADEQRMAIFEAVAPLVDALDIEFHAAIRQAVVKLAHKHGKLVIVSYHELERTSVEDDLIAIVDSAKLNHADIVKLAVTARSVADVDRLLGLLRAHRAKQLIVIALGPCGTASRVFFPLFGSLLTYAFLHEAVAPGQLPLDELHRELRRYAPDFARGK